MIIKAKTDFTPLCLANKIRVSLLKTSAWLGAWELGSGTTRTYRKLRPTNRPTDGRRTEGLIWEKVSLPICRSKGGRVRGGL